MLYNSLTRKKERFRPIDRDSREVRMYVCGVTPYDVGHLGHALVYVTFDTIRRWLEFQAFEVRHIQNITDIDDDMVRKSEELGISIAELTETNHALYLSEMDALNVLRPDAFPRVSGTIPEILEVVRRLVDTDFAYSVGGYVFFDSTKMPAFGALAGMTREQLLVAPRTDMMPDEPEHLKRDPLDFLLWQPSEFPEASWESHWGLGRPGWHIECSTMAQVNLGARLDIHGGGRDLSYPHHDSEIVQAEASTGEAPYVGTWMHTGVMMLDGVKMSKSLGNLVKVDELIAEGFSADAIRLALLGTHYRADRDFSRDDLSRWEERATLLRRAADGPGGPPDSLRVQPFRTEFMNAMDDDIDTPRAIEALFDLAAGIDERRIDGSTGIPTLIELAGAIGLRLGREG